ncbi:type II toxin-antitoxin system PemK/MazF family toxin [Raineyella sp. W15-4]|uniref:type II toxin-antitoxin system PemK/MazF family toxin n=1 Tax=Raineyella sp. W15-4 TaxID=3081651 RepID=UPI00295405DF|nr:type II toxin-antitoxin system PemK/MazF family toxin [Raineyella sp. W15-4]WOQ16785.1 type II toxin-antitoxin system PemK/MazF family toxin [Raineyella sp. W15-4]
MRGDVYRLRSPRNAEGHEQRGARYGVVVQSDHLPLSTTLIAPTSTSATPTDFRPRIEMDGIATFVLVEQCAAVNAETRLGDFAGRLTAAELAEIDRALAIVLGLY